MNHYEDIKARVVCHRGWPVSFEELCSILGIPSRFVRRAVVGLGMVKVYPEKKGRGRAPVFGFLADYEKAMEVWRWLFTHIEERIYIPGSKSRKIGGHVGCEWVDRWVAAATKDEPLPESELGYFKEVRRYTGTEIAKRYGVSKFSVSRVAGHLGYKGGWYLVDEARHLANCIIRRASATA